MRCIDYISDNDWHANHRQRKSQKAQKENNVQPQTELKEKRCKRLGRKPSYVYSSVGLNSISGRSFLLNSK